MTDIAAQYAKALFALAENNGKEGKAPASSAKRGEYLKNLKMSLEKRGHTKLLPKIFSEYKKLLLSRERMAMHEEVTPEKERTRVLLELYRKMTSSEK